MVHTYEKKYIRTLRNIAKNLENGLRTKHACMLTSGNKIINIGVNKSKSDPFQKINSSSHKANNVYREYSWVHAEVDTLKGIRMDFRKATLYVIRADEKGNLMESCPCRGCMSLINRLEIPRIVHSTGDGNIAVIENSF